MNNAANFQPFGLPSIEEIKECYELDILLNYLEKISNYKGRDLVQGNQRLEESNYYETSSKACKEQIKELFEEQESSISQSYSEYYNTHYDCHEED